MRRKLVIIGTGGMGRDALDSVRSLNQQVGGVGFELAGFLTNIKEQHGAQVCGLPVLGDETWLEGQSDVQVVCAIGDSRNRRRLVMALQQRAVSFATIIDPSVRISEYVKVGAGSIICAGAVLTTQVTVGEHVIININATINHDVAIDDFATIGPGVNITGRAHIGYGAELGAGCVVIPRKRVGRGALVGAGAVVIRDIEDNAVAVGVPAAAIKQFAADERL